MLRLLRGLPETAKFARELRDRKGGWTVVTKGDFRYTLSNTKYAFPFILIPLASFM
jgi:hypothetical protein